MKRISAAIIMLFLLYSSTFAQSVGIGTTTPHSSAMLEVKSFTKGMLLPRTSTASRLAIVNPAEGLILYDTTTSGFWFHNGSAWTQLSAGGNGWNLTGNVGTNPLSNFIGTSDNQPLRFRVNNAWAGEIHPTSGNVFLGLGAGQSNTTGAFNTANGNQALYSNTTGDRNTANGAKSLYFNTTGYANTATGFYSLTYNSTGNFNTANGQGALYSNTTGSNNSAIGAGALELNTTGSNNTANGYEALYANSSGNDNTASGYLALNSNTTGLGNTATGEEALFNNSTGFNNTAAGNLALTANSTGWDNTGIGVTALYSNTTGIENTATGRQSLFYNTTGEDNTASGYKALRNTNIGYRNTADGAYALYSNTTGTINTASGAYALFSNTTGNGNTALGFLADVSGDLQNATAIGSFAFVDASNEVRIGDGNVTSIGGQVGWSTLSDGRYKKNINEDVKGLSFINSLRPITYTVDISGLNAYYDKGKKHDSVYEKAKTSMQSSSDEAAKIVHNGFIAQDVEKAAQSIGYNFSGVDKPQTKDGLYGLRYSDFVVPLVKAMQEQQTIIEELKKQIAEIKSEMELLKNKN